MKQWTARMLAVGTMVMVALVGGCSGGEGAGETADAPAKPVHPGQQTYTHFCFSCHAAGVAGAPRMGDRDAWTERLSKGRDALIAATIEGIPPGMPERGLCMDCSDEHLAEVVDYMIEYSTGQ